MHLARQAANMKSYFLLSDNILDIFKLRLKMNLILTILYCQLNNSAHNHNDNHSNNHNHNHNKHRINKNQYKFIKMINDNSQLYHSHIINSIASLDKRKDGYVSHRLEFLTEYCNPIRKKIDHIKQDIKFYENMRDTQYQVIEAEPDVMKLKREIEDYRNTNLYYQGKLDQFDRTTAQLQVAINQRKLVLEDKRDQCRVLFYQNGGRSAVQLKQNKSINLSSQRNDQLSQRTVANRNYKKKSSYFSQNQHQKKAQNSITNSKQKLNSSTIINQSIAEDKLFKLPEIEIRKANKNYLESIQAKQQRRHERNRGRLDKIIQESQHYQSLNASMFANPEKDEDLLISQNSIKQVKHIISQFDHTQALFRQCFQRKKLSIQKSVSQLQSKLISNKQLFLTACQVIGQKKGKFSFQDFCQLTTDQLITLFISFGWLSRKVYYQLSQKRKVLMDTLKAMKSYQQYK